MAKGVLPPRIYLSIPDPICTLENGTWFGLQGKRGRGVVSYFSYNFLFLVFNLGTRRWDPAAPGTALRVSAPFVGQNPSPGTI